MAFNRGNRSISNRERLQDVYLRVFQEHYFTTICKRPGIFSHFAKINYAGRLWENYPILHAGDGREILYIHIPKCAGTSIAKIFGVKHFPHYPAVLFYLCDQERYKAAVKFSVVRDPLDRLASMIFHFRDSGLSNASDEKARNLIGETNEEIEAFIKKILSGEIRLNDVLVSTLAGRLGFTVSEYDYLRLGNTCIVDNIFCFNRLDCLETWLSERLDKRITLSSENNSGNSSAKLSFSLDHIRQSKAMFRADWNMYDKLCGDHS